MGERTDPVRSVRRLPFGSTPTTSAGHLSRARWRLAALYTVISAIGLLILGSVAVQTDARLRADGIDGQLKRRAGMAQALVRYDANTGQVTAQPLIDDAITTTEGGQDYSFVGYEFKPARARFEQVFTISTPLPGEIDVLPLIEKVFIEENDGGVHLDAVAADGRAIRLIGVPFYSELNEGKVAGVILVAAEPSAVIGHDNRLALWVWGGCAGLIALAALVGWWLAGRSLAPAAVALDQQERFLADAAHELRMPIARVFAVSESAQLTALLLTNRLKSGDLDDTTGEYLIELQRDLARATALTDQAGRTVDNLLTLARMDADRIQLELSPLRLDQLALVVAEAYPEVRVAHLDQAVVAGDAVLLRRAIENLVENAINHGRPTRVITLDGPDAVTDQEAAAPLLCVKATGARVAVTVEDRGAGIDAELIDGLFARFRSGTGSRGSGLGLSIVHWIADAHDGAIRVANRPDGDGGGAVFTLDLPRVVVPGDGGRATLVDENRAPTTAAVEHRSRVT